MQSYHDYRPSHPTRPIDLIEAERVELATRRAYDQALDRMLKAGEWDRAELSKLESVMLAAEACAKALRYHHMSKDGL